MSTESTESGSPPKPISIRDALGQRASKRPGSERKSSGAAPAQRDGTSRRQPTPARTGLTGPDGTGHPADPPIVRSKRFSVDGVAWSVEVVGIGRSGSRSDPGTSILHLSFVSETSKGESPREVVCTGADDLTLMSDERLRELLERSRPGLEAS